MELVLTEEEHQVLPRNRQIGIQQDDGTFVITLKTDPWVQIDAAIKDRDAMKGERDEARSRIEKYVADNATLKRSLTEFTTIGTAKDFALAKRQATEQQLPKDPKIVEIQQQIDALKKQREDEARKREAAEANRLADAYRGRVRDLVIRAGVRPEAVDMYTAWIERRGLNADDGRLLVGPADNARAAEDLIKEELSGSLSILVSGTAPAPNSPGGRPVPALEPDEVTLDGDPAHRQAALDKLSEQLYPNLVNRATGSRT